MCIFGVPSRIVSDRGSAFTSKTFSIFCKSYGIRHILNTVAIPRANGQYERYNKTIANMLATLSIEAESNLWDTHIKQLQSALNTSFNKSINTTPVKALFGYQTKTTAISEVVFSATSPRINENKKNSTIRTGGKPTNIRRVTLFLFILSAKLTPTLARNYYPSTKDLLG
jgi:transposase InsO family protein